MSDSPITVIVHAGFHKTGTTSLQKYLARNRKALRPYFDFYGQDDFKSAGARARIFAQRPFPWRRWRFRRAFARFLSSIPDAGTIVLSRETFCGVMPGHRDWRGRQIKEFKPAAVPLCRDVVTGLQRRFGQDVQITFLFTTREQGPWLQSVYGHLLRSIHLSETFDDFRAGFADMPRLEEQARQIGQNLQPHAVLTRALEDHATRHEGPASAILDLLDLPEHVRQTLPAATRENKRQTPDQEAEMMALNRSGLDKRRLRAAREKLLGRSGGRPR